MNREFSHRPPSSSASRHSGTFTMFIVFWPEMLTESCTTLTCERQGNPVRRVCGREPSSQREERWGSRPRCRPFRYNRSSRSPQTTATNEGFPRGGPATSGLPPSSLLHAVLSREAQSPTNLLQWPLGSTAPALNTWAKPRGGGKGTQT